MDNKQWWKNINQGMGGNSSPPNIGKFKGIIITAVIIILVIAVFSSMWYTVNDKQQAVVTTFGKVTDITGPGIHIKFPFGIQKAKLVDVNIFQRIELGYRTNRDGTTVSIDNESKMISGDYNIVNVDFFIEYKISDPRKYLYQSEDPDSILRDLAQSQIRNVISSYDVDRILTTGKNEIQLKIKDFIIEELDKYDLGLILSDVKIQDSEPPTEEVNEAFKEVETAKQDKETAINLAQAYMNSELPKAQAEADRLIQDSEYLKQNRINEANMQVAMFQAMFGEYVHNPAITRKRMYYEAIEKVLPGVKIYIDTSSGDTQKLLPLENFYQNDKEN